MTHPFWILNSVLLILLGCVSGVMFFFDTTIPEREEIEYSYIKKQEKSIQINIKKIYEHDLFETYKKELERRSIVDFGPPLPQPPQQRRFEIPEPSEPEFLDPLNILLKGIIVVGTNDEKNRAVIEQVPTKQEIMIKVGDSFEDAQLIRIFKNKIIFLRSNGQQEILYLREQDAKLDPSYALIDDWNDIVAKKDHNHYIIDPDVFITRITNLSQFIQLLGLTTAYKSGKSIGCHIASVKNGSFSAKLGLKTGDIITHINTMPISSVAQRLEAYKYVTSQEKGATFSITIMRNNTKEVISYTLQRLLPDENKTEKKPSTAQNNMPILSHDNPYMHVHMKPISNKIYAHDKKYMMSHSKQPSKKIEVQS